MHLLYLRASGLPSALSSPPASPDVLALAGRRKVLKQKMPSILGLRELGLYCHKPEACRVGIMLTSRRASRSRPGLGTGRAGLFTRQTYGGLILSHLYLPQACPVESRALFRLAPARFLLLNHSRSATTRAQPFHRGGAILKSCGKQDAPQTRCSLSLLLFSARTFELCFLRGFVKDSV